MFRPEFPNPQFRRDNWVNLNGTWSFCMDKEDNGAEKKYFEKTSFDGKIEVPFCPESVLSGIGHTDFINACWYAREIDIPESALTGRVLLHFGAVDYEATVYVNGKKAGAHKGGFISFCLDVTDYLTAGKNVLVVHARDNTKDPMIPSGKQSMVTFSKGCFYTRSTGIWQAVWMEFVPKNYIKNFRITPDIQNGYVIVEADVVGEGVLNATATYKGNYMANGARFTGGNTVTLSMKLKELHLWEVGNGRLYDLELEFAGDKVHTYFGMREVRIDGRRVLINGKSVYQRLVLDQGLYPDGIYTAKDEQALINDIEISLAAGFNGARLHQKIFEPLFLYHADRLGYIVWGEFPNWGLDHTDPASVLSFMPEWAEEIARDYNHPAIVGWCPFNETWDSKTTGKRQCDDVLATAYRMTKALDKTRPVIDTSGNFHVETDIYDLHNYKQDVTLFKTELDKLADGEVWDPNVKRPQPLKWDGKIPMFMSEYGGIRWSKLAGWGYGNAPTSEEEFKERYKGLTDALLDNPTMFAFCYTQLYDVEQEQNGLYTYEREKKFDDMTYFYNVNTRKAAIED